MKIKTFMLSMAAMTALAAGAQTQGYLDGIEYFKVDRPDNAKEILTNTLNDPATDRAEALYYLGAIALGEGDTATAKKYFDEGTQLDPKNGLNYVGLGSLALRAGDPKEADAMFKAAIKAQNKAFIHVAIARAYYEADPVAYQKEYTKKMQNAVDKDKKEPAYYVMLGDAARDRAVSAGVDDPAAIGDAAAQYNQAIYFNKNAPEAYVKYSRVYAKVNPQYAIDKLIELNEVAPTSAMAQRELAERYYDSDQWTKAAEQYGKYISNPNSFKADKERYAVLLFFGEKYDESLDVVNEVLATDPNSVQMRRMLFLNLEKKGDLQGAKAAADAFFAMPDVKFTSNDYATYADILKGLDDADGELTAREMAVAANPDKTDLLKDLSSAATRLGSAAYAEKDMEKANGYFVKALESFAKYIDAGDYSTQDLVDFASRYQNVASTSPEDSEERLIAINAAIAAIDKVIERVPDNFIPVRNKARMTVVKNGGNPSEESVTVYQQMLDLLNADPENLTKRKDTYIEAYNMIAKYSLQNQDPDSAKEWYEKYLEIDPENEALRDYISKLGTKK